VIELHYCIRKPFLRVLLKSGYPAYSHSIMAQPLKQDPAAYCVHANKFVPDMLHQHKKVSPRKKSQEKKVNHQPNPFENQ
jgi:hypothetical protein